MLNRAKSNLKLLVIVLFVLLANMTIAQKVLFPLLSFNEYVMQFDIQNCSFDTICQRITDPPPSPPSYDFAITPDGDIYSSEDFWGFYVEYVGKYEDMTVGRSDIHFTDISHIAVNLNWGSHGAILSNNKGDILCLSNDLYKYFPKENRWEYKGTLPKFYDNNSSDYHYYFYNNAHPGTLTRVANKFYFVTHGERKYNNATYQYQKLIRLDTQNVDQSKYIADFPDTIGISGMFTIRNTCDDYTTYVAYNKYSDSSSTRILSWAFGEIDIATGDITEICTKQDSTLRDAIAAGVPWTILDSDCIVTIDLDLDNSSGAQGRYDYTDTVGCRYDSIYLSDIDPEVFAKTYIDSLQVFFVGATADGANEYLEVSNPGGLGINWRNPKFVTFINNTNDDFLPLEVAVRNIVYRNISSSPTLGERKIAFVAYSGKRQSDTAYAFINLIDDKPYAGRDTMLNLCVNDAPVYLDSLLSDNADMQGLWTGTTMQSGVFDPITDDTGIYQYIVEKDGCTTDTAEIEINVNQLPEFDLGEDTLICEGDMLELTCNIEGADYLWQDGSTTKDYTVQDSGLYVLQVTDDEGCQYTDSIRVGLRQGASSEVHKDTTLCYAQSINWNGIQINTAGDYSYNTANVFGCDSTTILNVTYYPEINLSIQGDTMFCQGDKVTLSAGDYPQYLWSTGDTVSHIQVEEGGDYYLEVTDENGCTAFDSIYVREIEALQISVDVQDESCYGEQDGVIIIHFISGGIGEKHYYINGSEVMEGKRYNDLSPGKYTVEIEDSLGCMWTDQVQIDSARKLQVSLGEDIIIEDEGKIINLVANNNFDSISNVQWYIDGEETDNKQLEYQFEPSQDTKVVVVLTNEKGCIQSDTVNITISIIDENADIYIPDIFTPDGDGINDTWSIQASDAIQEIELVGIYDRWGENIYSREHIPVSISGTSLWDGRYKDKPVNPGVYVYYIIFKTHTGKSIRRSGDITVIR
ncbi:MAG TPA: gliding motility-associated C-terminal domain-containing protein [Bacteroidetes bacterium]|nr:gliding motility-associated C-terminal domain-containing protein [Bacteroidota bacterium]